MPRPKRNLLATAQETLSPPASLDEGHTIAKIWKAEGKNLYSVELPSRKEPLLVELPSRFRSQIWMKRGGYVVVDTTAFADRDNKLDGEIVNVVRDEREWRKQSYWSVHSSVGGCPADDFRPSEFVKKSSYPEDSDGDKPMMPPSDDSDKES
ncbi:MAG: hypothetical protein LQ346_001637 [Caloplaca aetnensis]|nr:MAG: hypothetical protein LQ346_001637 [Caloplaca aetnensis]